VRFAAGVACAVWFIIAGARLVAGWRRSGFVRDGLLVLRAVCKLAVGALLLCWHLPSDLLPSWLYQVASGALFFFGLWLAVTGLVRFVLLVRPAGSALPEVQGDIAANEFDWNG
jgi:hypothetical protein